MNAAELAAEFDRRARITSEPDVENAWHEAARLTRENDPAPQRPHWTVAGLDGPPVLLCDLDDTVRAGPDILGRYVNTEQSRRH